MIVVWRALFPPPQQGSAVTRPDRGCLVEFPVVLAPAVRPLRLRGSHASTGREVSLAACTPTQLRCSCQSPHSWEPFPNGPATRADRGGRVRHACACAITPASSHACSSSRPPQRACTSEHALTIQERLPRRTTGAVGPGASGMGHAPPRAGPYTAVVMAALAGCPHEVPAAAYGVGSPA